MWIIRHQLPNIRSYNSVQSRNIFEIFRSMTSLTDDMLSIKINCMDSYVIPQTWMKQQFILILLIKMLLFLLLKQQHMFDPAMPNLSFLSKKMKTFFFLKEVYKYARHIFLTLNLKPMAIIRTTKMKCSLFPAIIQREGYFTKAYKVYISISLRHRKWIVCKKNLWYMLLAISANE